MISWRHVLPPSKLHHNRNRKVNFRGIRIQLTAPAMAEKSRSVDPETVIFDLELEAEKDVDSMLGEFVSLVRLGLRDSARQLAKSELWPHIDFFPVFAEIGASLVLDDDTSTAAELVGELEQRAIVFEQRDEQSYVEMMVLFAQKKTSQLNEECPAVEDAQMVARDPSNIDKAWTSV